ncbi:MBL fold metallo-hydrolase [Patescibacteria group bacterium]|nr:MBL fold metallo-hydrolase [Patescibacteria group bacterium]MBU1895950.1 MBL fold metallo-hydrolase [Patescibacteria group bacterium]
MHLTWLGTTAIKIQTKHNGNDVVLIIDPYKPSVGAFPRSLAPDIGLYTRGEKNSITLSGKPFILSQPGECETGGVLITATAGHEPGSTILRIDAEGISVAHLGLINKTPTNKQFDVISGVDVLCLPVGNADAFTAEAAMKIVSIIEPKIIIPMAYKSDNDPDAKPVDNFLKEMGASSEKPESKAILKKKDLPQEETQVIVLTKE